jgi:nucleotide-binding universal stress UspA family protein
MYSSILVPLDGSGFSEQILPYVRLLAGASRSAVELLHIRDGAARPPFTLGTQPIDAYLKEVAAKYVTGGDVRITILEGDPAEAIISRAKANRDCAVAMTTHGLSGLRRWLLGSIARKVAQGAENPLLLIRPQESGAAAEVKLKTVIVPLDGSTLAESVLPHVISLARALALEVNLVRVYALPASAYVVAEGVAGAGPAPFREAAEKESGAYLDGKVAELRAAGIGRVLATTLEGEPAGEIIDLARKTPANLIAISTHGRSGIGRWLLGSVAERVLQHSGDPVLLIRPVE